MYIFEYVYKMEIKSCRKSYLFQSIDTTGNCFKMIGYCDIKATAKTSYIFWNINYIT